ncbi:hypothetical protein HK102_004824 [Quaeritorhiza haematococci]|nr:hypothetical protein HK102_004824 [Quaeritorhiza haematococci]
MLSRIPSLIASSGVRSHGVFHRQFQGIATTSTSLNQPTGARLFELLNKKRRNCCGEWWHGARTSGLRGYHTTGRNRSKHIPTLNLSLFNSRIDHVGCEIYQSLPYSTKAFNETTTEASKPNTTDPSSKESPEPQTSPAPDSQPKPPPSQQEPAKQQTEPQVQDATPPSPQTPEQPQQQQSTPTHPTPESTPDSKNDDDQAIVTPSSGEVDPVIDEEDLGSGRREFNTDNPCPTREEVAESNRQSSSDNTTTATAGYVEEDAVELAGAAKPFKNSIFLRAVVRMDFGFRLPYCFICFGLFFFGL